MFKKQTQLIKSLFSHSKNELTGVDVAVAREYIENFWKKGEKQN